MRPVVPSSIADVLDVALDAEPDREALVTRSRRLTYAELDGQANRAADALLAFGVRPGDRVAVSLPNEADVVVAFHGAMRIGAVWVGVNRALAPPEKAYLLADSGASLYLCDPATADQSGAFAEVATLRRIVTIAPGPDGREWLDAVASARDERPGVTVDPTAPAGLAYTSGTTGRPKGAVHSQHNLLLPGAVLVATRGYGPDLRKGDCLPLTVLNMMVLTTLLVAQASGCCVVMDRIDPEGIAGWVRDEQVTTWNGVPAMLHGLATNDAVRPDDLASLDEVWTGGGDCPEAVRAMFEAKFGHEVLATYGLTEAPTIVSIDPRGGPHVAGSSGRPLPHLAVRVADVDGAAVAPGETGEICVAATAQGAWAGRYRPMLGYWERPDATAEVLRSGELRTGDLGFIDPGGDLHVRDRRSLVIIRGGANVYPAEVERVLHDAPGVAACAVLGLPDERLGERVVAAVEPAPSTSLDLDELRRHCAANLAAYKVPERFVVVDGFPRNSMGKIVRRDLAARLAAGDGPGRSG
ncbi:MAG: class I adenylate-forming enzyme family protein [Acidimicrobiales bacterium]